MRILVASQASWNTSNSFGNTVTNWFDDWKGTQFFHVYARQQWPNTDIVDKYYNVSAIEILSTCLKRKQSGKIIKAIDVPMTDSIDNINSEQKLIAKLHKRPNNFIYWVMESIWRSGKWINSNYEQFEDYADPDIVFAFAADPFFLKPLLKHIKVNKPTVKIVLWVADDILTGFEQNAWYRRMYLKKDVDFCFSVADRLYGASAEMCEKYSLIYGKEVTPLYKGCCFDKPIKAKNNTPLRLAYAGNLLYGRNETIKEIIKALRVINLEQCKAVLEVYSSTPIEEKEKKQWFDNVNAFYMGIRPYEEIKSVLNEADIVLHVESFEKDQIDAVKYSFSTKIIDCLQSGSAVVGIGPANIASIEYLRKVNGAVLIDKRECIESGIKQIIHSDLIERAALTRQFAIEKHDMKKVRERLHDEFMCLLRN